MDWLSIRHWAEFQAFRCIACVLELLSVRQTRRMAHAFAWLLADVLPRRMTRYCVAAENIQRAFPEYSAAQTHDMIRRMWVHLFRMLAEMVQAPRKLALVNCRECIVFRNRAPVVEALTQGRPVLVLGGHYGNWEMSLNSFGMFQFPMGVIAREMDNPWLNDWFRKTREECGHKIYLKKGNFDGITDLLAAGGNLMLLGDQDAGRRGVFVDFFGAPASTFKSIALMALEYRALIVVGYGRRLPDEDQDARWVRYEVGCEDVIDVERLTSRDEIREITERYTRALERAIRRSPEQYFWVHRRWKTPPRERLRRAA